MTPGSEDEEDHSPILRRSSARRSISVAIQPAHRATKKHDKRVLESLEDMVIGEQECEKETADDFDAPGRLAGSKVLKRKAHGAGASAADAKEPVKKRKRGTVLLDRKEPEPHSRPKRVVKAKPSARPQPEEKSASSAQPKEKAAKATSSSGKLQAKANSAKDKPVHAKTTRKASWRMCFGADPSGHKVFDNSTLVENVFGLHRNKREDIREIYVRHSVLRFMTSEASGSNALTVRLFCDSDCRRRSKELLPSRRMRDAGSYHMPQKKKRKMMEATAP